MNMEQPPSFFAPIYALAGVSVSDDDTGWSKEIWNGETLRMVEFTKGRMIIAVYDDGSFKHVVNDIRRESASATAKAGDSTVQLANSEQAYQRAQTVLTNLNLWRTDYVRGACDLGLTEGITGNGGLFDGQAIVQFETVHNGLEISPSGDVTVTLNRFTGEVAEIDVPHAFNFPSATPTISEAQARTNAIAFVTALPTTDDQRQACLDALAQAPVTLAFLRKPSTADPYRLELGYYAKGGAIHLEINAITGVVLERGRAKGSSSSLVPDAGSLDKQTQSAESAAISSPADTASMDPLRPILYGALLLICFWLGFKALVQKRV